MERTPIFKTTTTTRPTAGASSETAASARETSTQATSLTRTVADASSVARGVLSSGATTRVQPGEVISAALMNEILEQLEELLSGAPTDLTLIQQRLQALEVWRQTLDPNNDLRTGLAALETRVEELEDAIGEIESLLQISGKVRISGFDPPVQTPIGQVLTILGTGFVSPLIDNLVFINDIPLYNLRLDSDATHLRIIVPNIPGLTAPTDVTVRVANDDGEAQRTYRVAPPLSLPGTPPRIDGVTNLNGGSLPLSIGSVAEVRGVGLTPSGGLTGTVATTATAGTDRVSLRPRGGAPAARASTTLSADRISATASTDRIAASADRVAADRESVTIDRESAAAIDREADAAAVDRETLAADKTASVSDRVTATGDSAVDISDRVTTAAAGDRVSATAGADRVTATAGIDLVADTGAGTTFDRIRDTIGVGPIIVSNTQPTVRFIVKTNTGPVVYNAPNVWFAQSTFIQFDVPDIREITSSTPLTVLLVVEVGSHVPALANVPVRRLILT